MLGEINRELKLQSVDGSFPARSLSGLSVRPHWLSLRLKLQPKHVLHEILLDCLEP